MKISIFARDRCAYLASNATVFRASNNGRCARRPSIIAVVFRTTDPTRGNDPSTARYGRVTRVNGEIYRRARIRTGSRVYTDRPVPIVTTTAAAAVRFRPTNKTVHTSRVGRRRTVFLRRRRRRRRRPLRSSFVPCGRVFYSFFFFPRFTLARGKRSQIVLTAQPAFSLSFRKKLVWSGR